MGVPFALMAAGTGMQMIGNIMSNLSGASAERENEKYYREQAEYARESARRAEKIAEFDYTTKVGSQISGYAAGGVQLSGSAQLTTAGTIGNMINEIFAIRKKGQLESRLAELRAGQSSSRADMLGSFGFNALQGAATLTNNYTVSGGFGQGFPDWMTGKGATTAAARLVTGSGASSGTGGAARREM